MREENLYVFKAQIEIIGINPYVSVPEDILLQIFKDAGRDKSPIPINGAVNGKSYQQTLMRYRGHWRLYINTSMLKKSPQRVGEWIDITVAFDPLDRILKPPVALVKALEGSAIAKTAFEQLTPSLKKEVVRYIASLKTEEKVEENVNKAINFLLGNGKFVGRELKK